MGCKGSSVRITPSRPKNPKKSSHLAVTGFFYARVFWVSLFVLPLWLPIGCQLRLASPASGIRVQGSVDAPADAKLCQKIGKLHQSTGVQSCAKTGKAFTHDQVRSANQV